MEKPKPGSDGRGDKPDFQLIATLRTPEGVVGQISARMQASGRRQLTFCFKKEFDRNGEPMTTPWLQKQHLAALRKLIDEVEDRLALEEDRDRAAVRGRAE